jgi:hypothetical protein
MSFRPSDSWTELEPEPVLFTSTSMMLASFVDASAAILMSHAEVSLDDD